MNIKLVYKQTLRRSDTYTNRTLDRAECPLDRSELAIKTYISEVGNKAKASKKEQGLQKGIFLVRNGKKVIMSRFCFVLSGCKYLDEALYCVTELFNLFGKNVFQTYGALFCEVM